METNIQIAGGLTKQYCKKYDIMAPATPATPPEPQQYQYQNQNLTLPPYDQCIENTITLASHPDLYDIELIERLVKLYANYFKEDTDNRYIEIFGIPKNGVDEIIDISRNSKNIDTCTNNCTSSSNQEKQICFVNNQEIIDNARYLLARCDTLHDFMFGLRNARLDKNSADALKMLNGRIETALNKNTKNNRISYEELKKINYKPEIFENIIKDSPLKLINTKFDIDRENVNLIIKYYTYSSLKNNLIIPNTVELEEIVIIINDYAKLDDYIQIKSYNYNNKKYKNNDIKLYNYNYGRAILGGWILKTDNLISDNLIVTNELEILRSHPFFYINENLDIIKEEEINNRNLTFLHLRKLDPTIKKYYVIYGITKIEIETKNTSIEIHSKNYKNYNKTLACYVWSENKDNLYISNKFLSTLTDTLTDKCKFIKESLNKLDFDITFQDIYNTKKRSYNDIKIGDIIYSTFTDNDNSLENYIFNKTGNYQNINSDSFKIKEFVDEDNIIDKNTYITEFNNLITSTITELDDSNFTFEYDDSSLSSNSEPKLTKEGNKLTLFKGYIIDIINEELDKNDNELYKTVMILYEDKKYKDTKLYKNKFNSKEENGWTYSESIKDFNINKGIGYTNLKKLSKGSVLTIYNKMLTYSISKETKIYSINSSYMDDVYKIETISNIESINSDNIELYYRRVTLNQLDDSKRIKTITEFLNGKLSEINNITGSITEIKDTITNIIDNFTNRKINKMSSYKKKLKQLKKKYKNVSKLINDIHDYVYKYDILDDYNTSNKKYYYLFAHKYGNNTINFGWANITDEFDSKLQNLDDNISSHNYNDIVTKYIEDYLYSNNININSMLNGNKDKSFNYNLVNIEFKKPDEKELTNPVGEYFEVLRYIQQYLLLENSNLKKIGYCVDVGDKFVTNNILDEENIFRECNILHYWDSATGKCKLNNYVKNFPEGDEKDNLKFTLYGYDKSNFNITNLNNDALLNNSFIGINSVKHYNTLEKQNNTEQEDFYNEEDEEENEENEENIIKGDTPSPSPSPSRSFSPSPSPSPSPSSSPSPSPSSSPSSSPSPSPSSSPSPSQSLYIYKTVDLLIKSMIENVNKDYSPKPADHILNNNKVYENDVILNYPLDIKRSGDACQLIRTKYLNETSIDTIYVFVTIDELAFLSARLQNIPAILIHRKNYLTKIGVKYENKTYINLILYNPYKPPQDIKNPKEIINDEYSINILKNLISINKFHDIMVENNDIMVENNKKRNRRISNYDEENEEFYDIEEYNIQNKRQKFIEVICNKSISFINTNFDLISKGFKKIFNYTCNFEKSKITKFKKKRNQQGGSDEFNDEIKYYFADFDPLLYEESDNLILKIFEDSKTTIETIEYYDISNIYYNTSAYYRFIMDLRNVSDINEIINMTVEFVMYRIALWDLDYDYKYFETEVQRLEGIITSEIISDPHCKKCISQYEYYEAVLKYYLLLQLPEAQTQDTNIPNFDATSDGRDIMCYIMSKPYDMYVKYKNYFSLQYFQASNIDSGIQIPQKSPSPSALTSAQQIQQANKSENKENNRIGIAAGGSPAPANPQTKPKGPLKLLDYHKKYFPAYEKLYYSKK